MKEGPKNGEGKVVNRRMKMREEEEDDSNAVDSLIIVFSRRRHLFLMTTLAVDLCRRVTSSAGWFRHPVSTATLPSTGLKQTRTSKPVFQSIRTLSTSNAHLYIID